MSGQNPKALLVLGIALLTCENSIAETFSVTFCPSPFDTPQTIEQRLLELANRHADITAKQVHVHIHPETASATKYNIDSKQSLDLELKQIGRSYDKNNCIVETWVK